MPSTRRPAGPADPAAPAAPVPLLTVGHGTAGRRELELLLTGVEAGLLVDVRRFPGSRRNPDVSREALAAWLPEAGIAYRWDERLGGRRRVPAGDRDGDGDRWWRVESFRAYAAHTRTPEFRAAVDDLLVDLDAVAPARTLIMCSESLWWRCHRRLISDVVLLLHDRRVEHLGHDGRTTAHRPSEGARVTPDGLRYDADADADASAADV
jgi:uncharacterized protein (DUF488 family)